MGEACQTRNRNNNGDGSKLSSLPWFDLRVFYVRISNFKVNDWTPSFLTVNYTPLDPETVVEINGERLKLYSEGISTQLRRDRVDKRSEEATFVSTDNIRLTGSVKFEVYDKTEMILSGNLEMSGCNDMSINCEAGITVGSDLSLPLPRIEVYVTGCGFSGEPIILTKALQLGFRKKHYRRIALDSIPEYGPTEPKKNSSSEFDFQATEYADYKRGYILDDVYWRRECMDGEMSWFKAGVRVGVGIGFGVCVGLGLGIGLLVRTYQSNTRNFRRRLL